MSLDAASGKTQWRVERGRGINSYSTPLVVAAGGNPEIIVNSSEGVSGHSAADGRILWHIQETNRFPIPMPVFHDGTIYTSRGYRSGPYMAIRPGGSGDVAAAMCCGDRHGLHVRIVAGALQRLLYMAGDVGVLSAVDAKSGSASGRNVPAAYSPHRGGRG